MYIESVSCCDSDIMEFIVYFLWFELCGIEIVPLISLY